jgi:SAM-dependent methyltransferase
MDCCSPEEFEIKDNFFSARAKKYSKRFRKKGLNTEQKYLVTGIVNAFNGNGKFSPSSVLEIGCGTAGLLVTLLNKGAAFATGIDAARGMIDAAKENALLLQLNNKTKFLQGDFATIENMVARSEVVVLDRVLCCDGNPELLIRKSALKAEKVYAVSFPRDFFPVRIFVKTGIAIARLFPVKFLPFYHEPSQLHRWIQEQGFSLKYSRHTFLWQVLIYRRNN